MLKIKNVVLSIRIIIIIIIPVVAVKFHNTIVPRNHKPRVHQVVREIENHKPRVHQGVREIGIG